MPSPHANGRVKTDNGWSPVLPIPPTSLTQSHPLHFTQIQCTEICKMMSDGIGQKPVPPKSPTASNQFYSPMLQALVTVTMKAVNRADARPTTYTCSYASYVGPKSTNLDASIRTTDDRQRTSLNTDRNETYHNSDDILTYDTPTKALFNTKHNGLPRNIAQHQIKIHHQNNLAADTAKKTPLPLAGSQHRRIQDSPVVSFHP